MGAPEGASSRTVVTFLLTDVEGSTQLWERDASVMDASLRIHDALLDDAITAAGGRVVKERGEGDSTFSVFERPSEAVSGALAARRALDAAPWPDGFRLDVRFALHVGEVSTRDGDYYGTAVNRAARLRGLAVGGQILVSAAVAAMTADDLPDGARLVALGAQRLRGLTRAEQVFALVDPLCPAPEALGGYCPYLGLLSFQPEDHDVYFGREQLVADLVEQLRSRRFVVVAGASGSGKSSLVRAGVVAALRQTATPNGRGWSIAVMAPGNDPVAALHAARRATADGGPRLLVIDQFEELYTNCTDAAVRGAFVDEMLDAVGRSDDPLHVLVALRSDFYGHCDSIPRLAEVLSHSTVLLTRMDEGQLRRAIEGPAEVAGLRLEPGLVDVVLGDLGREPGSLPLLSHALLETWQRRSGRTLTVAAYEEAGSVRGAIARTAEAIWDRLDEEERRLTQQVLVRLTDLGDGTEDTRRRVSRSELVSGSKDEELLGGVLDTLAGARLVTVDADTVEVAHEALIREWPRLRRWLDDGRTLIRLQRHLNQAAAGWLALGRDRAELYRGPRLASVRELLDADSQVTLNELEREFLEASVESEEADRRAGEERSQAQERANRRLRVLLAGTAVALLVAVALGAWAIEQRDRADEEAARARAAIVDAEVNRIVSELPSLLAGDRVLAGLLAVEAERLRPDPATQGALLSTLLDEPRLISTIHGGSVGYFSAAAFPDGRRLVALGTEGIDVWDLEQRQSVRRLALDHGTAMALSLDGELLVVGASDGALSFWESSDLSEPLGTVQLGDAIIDLAVSPDASMVAVAFGEYGRAERSDPQLVDVASGRVGTTLTGHEVGVHALAYSPDGTYLATGDVDGVIALRDVGTGEVIGPPMTLDPRLEVHDIVFSPNGQLLVAGPFGAGASSSDAPVSVFDVSQRAPVATGLGSQSVSVDIAFDGGGRQLYVTGSAGILETFATDTSSEIGEPVVLQHGPALVVPLDDGTIAVTGFDGTVSLYSGAGSTAIGERVPGSAAGGGAFDPSGGQLATVGYDGTVMLHRGDHRTPLPLPSSALGPRIAAPPVAFSPTDAVVAVGGRDGTVYMFDTATLALLDRTFGLSDNEVIWLQFSPDGRTLAATTALDDGNGAHVIDMESGTIHAVEPPMPYALSPSFSPDGSHLLIWRGTGGGAVYPIDMGAPRPGEPVGGTGDGVVAAYDPRGSFVAVGMFDGTVELRDPTTWSAVDDPIEVTGDLIAGLVASPSGRFLAVVDLDSRVHLVDADERKSLGQVFGGDRRGVGRPSFSPDGSSLLLPDRGGSVLVPLDVEDWRIAACQRAGRRLTSTERARYFSLTPDAYVTATPGC